MSGGWGLGVRSWWLQGLVGVVLGVLLLLGSGAMPVGAAHKVPNVPPMGLLVAQDDAPPVVQAAATPAPTSVPTPAPATGGLTLDRFAVGFLLIVVGTLGAGLAVLGLRRARRLRDAALPTRDSPSRRS